VFGTSACRFLSTDQFRSCRSVTCIYKYASVVSEVVAASVVMVLELNLGTTISTHCGCKCCYIEIVGPSEYSKYLFSLVRIPFIVDSI
jgi:hypothetical protein